MEYSCTKCNFKIIKEDEMFHINTENDEFKEYPLLMNTYKWSDGADIIGYILRTYCPHCDKLIKIYSIKETKYDEEETIKKLEEKLEITPIDNSFYFFIEGNRIEYEHNKKHENNTIITLFKRLIVSNLKKHELRNHFMEKFTTTDKILNYIEYNESFINMVPFEQDHIFPDFIECPECKGKVYRTIGEKDPCPICGGKIKNTMDILRD